MQYCSKCGNPQQSGAFCGKCGNPMGEQTTPTNPQQPNPQVEALKKQSQVYFQFFMRVLKNPSLSFQEPGQHSKHSLLNLLVLFITMAFAFTTLFYVPVSPMLYEGKFGFFFKTFFLLLFLLIILYALLVLAISFGTFISGNGFQFKQMLEHTGSNASYFIALFLAIGILRFIGLLPTFITLLFFATLMFLFYILPFYLLNRTIFSNPIKIDPIIVNIILMLTIWLVYYIYILMLIDQTIAGIPIEDILDELFWSW